MCELIIINADEDRAIVRQEFMQEPQTRVHHAEPFIVAREILALLADNLAKPLFHLKVVDIVIVHPTFLTRVVRRIDVNAIDLALELREEGLQGGEIVAVDDHVPRAVVLFVASVLVETVNPIQDVHRHVQMVVDDLVFSGPVQRRHRGILSVWRSEGPETSLPVDVGMAEFLTLRGEVQSNHAAVGGGLPPRKREIEFFARDYGNSALREILWEMGRAKRRGNRSWPHHAGKDNASMGVIRDIAFHDF